MGYCSNDFVMNNGHYFRRCRSRPESDCYSQKASKSQSADAPVSIVEALNGAPEKRFAQSYCGASARCGEACWMGEYNIWGKCGKQIYGTYHRECTYLQP